VEAAHGSNRAPFAFILARSADLKVYAQVTPLEDLSAERKRLEKLFEASPAARATFRMAVKIALAGGQIGASEYHSARKPYCDDPVLVGRRTHPSDPVRTIEVSMWAPCRKCGKCLLFRQMKWRARAVSELRMTHERNKRSWWITLTFSPHHLAGILIEASKEKGNEVQRVDAAAYRHVQLFFKRLRKQGAKFRYFAVFERGETTGRPHYHLFLHEIGSRPIIGSQIESQWRSHVHARLVNMDGAKSGLASYITKYATKSVDTRPRASQGYGNGGCVKRS